jgi:hypothetical protein
MWFKNVLHSYLKWIVTKIQQQNVGIENLNLQDNAPLQPINCRICCVLPAFCNVGPESLEDNVKSEYCGTLLRDAWFPFCRVRIVMWIKYVLTDIAQLHTANALLDSITGLIWTAGLTDMYINPCVYILRGFLTDYIHCSCLQSTVPMLLGRQEFEYDYYIRLAGYLQSSKVSIMVKNKLYLDQ